MSELIKSDVDGLEFQNRGVLVNTNRSEFESYVKRRNAMAAKDAEVRDLQSKVSTLSEQLEKLLSTLNILKPE